MRYVDSPQTYCRAALARRDITPPVGIYHRMSGAATHDRATGVHRPLTCTALALAPEVVDAQRPDAAALQVVVAVDHCLLWSDEADQLRSAACDQAGLPAGQLHIAFSHTHAAGLMDPARADLPGGEMIAPYLETLAAQIAEAAGEAVANLAPVRIVYGHGRCSLAAQRDFWDADNQLFVCGYDPTGPTDDTVLVARLVDAQGATRGTLVNYACHPTTLAWQNTLLSPDYVGAMREVIENATGAPCVFLQGASGDLGPRRGFVGDVNVADQNGRMLGYAALAALESLPEPGVRFTYAGPVVSGATLGTWEDRPLPAEAVCEKQRWRCDSREIPLRRRPDLASRAETEAELSRWLEEQEQAHARRDDSRARDCHAQAERMRRQLTRLGSLPPGETIGVPTSVWRLGDAIWVLLAGEHYHWLQTALRERFREHPVIVSTVTNGWRPGYLPTAETYGRGIYQESIAVVAPGSLEALQEAIVAQVAALSGN